MSTNAMRLVQADLEQAEFMIGVEKSQWSLARPITQAEWPAVFTWISAAPRASAPAQYLVRWDVDGYNAAPPNGAFWDEQTGTYRPKEAWPKGRPGSVVANVFKVEGWAAPGRGFYHPYDRLALAGHNQQWVTQNPRRVWSANNTLTDFVALVHRWLTCEDYIGC